MKIRIVLAEVHPMVREGLCSLLQLQSDMELAGQSSDGRGAIELAGQTKPDVLVADADLPDLNGAELVRRIKDGARCVRVVAMAKDEDPGFLRELFEAGVDGVVLKGSVTEDLTVVIRSVMRRQMAVSPQLSTLLMAWRREHGFENGDGSLRLSALSPREREVLQRIAEGWSMQEIAQSLGLSVKTVETHRLHVVQKLQIRSVAKLTKYAIREGLTGLEE